MITEEEVRKAAHFRFGGVSDDHSAFRGVFIHGAMWAIAKMNEGTIKPDDWTKTSDILPPVSTKVECAVQLPGLICKAWLFDITRNEGEAYARFLVDDLDKIIFICPKYWRFIK